MTSTPEHDRSESPKIGAARAIYAPLPTATLDMSGAAALAAALRELELYAETDEARAGRVLASLVLDLDEIAAPAVH